jgi:hypothetical protein
LMAIGVKYHAVVPVFTGEHCSQSIISCSSFSRPGQDFQTADDVFNNTDRTDFPQVTDSRKGGIVSLLPGILSALPQHPCP